MERVVDFIGGLIAIVLNILLVGGACFVIIDRFFVSHEEQLDSDFKGAVSQRCTFWTTTYPMREFTIYAVNEGEKQYLRMDHFVSGATGKQAEYIIVRSGTTYVWNTWNKNHKEGVKFKIPPAPFEEYFNINSIKRKEYRCDSWKPEKARCFTPGYVTFRDVSVNEFERDEMYTPVLKTYIRKQLKYP